MTNCHCEHGPADHAPVQDFGISMCLTPGCDCDGTVAQVAALNMERQRRMSPTGERLVALIAEVLANPMHRTTDEKARNIAACIMGNFELEAR